MALIDSIKNRALYIGLGGTGQDILLKIRERMINVFGEIPNTYFKFLAIDADSLEHNVNYITNDEEGNERVVNIGFNNGSENGYLNQTDFVNIVKGTPGMRDFCPDYYVQFAPAATKGKGAGQVRMTGKICLVYQLSTVKDKINQQLKLLRNLDNARGIDEEKGIYVFVFGSLAGGTCSGMSIDIAHIIANECTNFKSVKDNLWGIFAMPCFFDKIPARDRINFNAYGALRELEFWHNASEVTKAGIKPFGIRNVKPNPYDQIMLIHSTFLSGVNIDYSGMLEAVATGIMTLSFHDTLSGMVNSNQKSHTMDGKLRSFSSFGVTELVLKRNRLIKYITDRVIQKEISQLLENNISQSITTESVSDYINKNNLNEGVGSEAAEINQLTNLICMIDDEKLQQIKMADVASGNEAATKIINSKENYLARFNGRLTSVYNSKEKTLNEIYNQIERKIEELKLVPGGISRAIKFVRNMSNQITAMRTQLEKEILVHKYNIQKIDSKLNIIHENIKNAKGIFGWNKKEQKSEIEQFRAIVSLSNSNKPNLSLKTQIIELFRKEKAISVYNNILSILRRYFNEVDENISTGLLVSANKKLSKAYDEVEISIQQFRPLDRDGIVINLHYFLKNIIDSELDKESNNIVKSNIELKTLFDNINFESDSSEDILKKLRKIILDENTNNNTLLAHLRNKNFSVENFMLSFFDDQSIKKIITLCNDSLSVMWEYENMELPPDGHEEKKDTDKYPVIGRFPITTEGKRIFVNDSDFVNYLKTLNMDVGVKTVDFLDPDRVVFYLQEGSVPAFKLKKADLYKKEYDQKKNSRQFYSFTDKRIEQFNDSLFPLKGDPYRWWTIGCVLEQILIESKSYKIYTKKTRRGVLGMEDLVKESKGKANRKIAFEKFSADISFSDEIKKIYEKEMTDDKQGLKNKIINYCHFILDRKNIGKGIDSLEEGEESIIQKEKQILVDIALNELGIKEEELISDYFTLREIKALSN